MSRHVFQNYSQQKNKKNLALALYCILAGCISYFCYRNFLKFIIYKLQCFGNVTYFSRYFFYFLSAKSIFLEDSRYIFYPEHLKA